MTIMKSMPRLAALLAFVAGGAFATTWDNVAIGGGGFVSGIIPSKTEQGVVYARTDVGGAYRWDKVALKWKPLLDWVSENEAGYLGIDSLAVDPKNAAKVYMLAGIDYTNNGKTVILRSSDYGQTYASTDVTAQFKTHGNGMGRQNGERLVVDPGTSSILYVGTRYNGLFKSTDSGATWTHMNGLNVTTTANGAGISFVLPDRDSLYNGVAQRILVGVSRFGSAGANLYVSTNAGTTFTAVSGSPSDLMPQRAIYDGAGNMFITYGNGAGPQDTTAEPMDQGKIFKYSVGSGAMTNVTPAGINRAFSGISVANGNAQRLVASTINTYMQQGTAWGDRIFISTNGGASWTDVIARGYALDTGGVSWVGKESIHWAGSIEFDPYDSKSVWVTSGNGIFKTSDIDAATTTWRFDVKGLEETVPLNLVSVPGGPLVSVIGDYDGFRHTNTAAYAPMHTPAIGTTYGLAHAVGNNGALVRVGANSMYYTWDGGNSWTKSAVMNGSFGYVALSANGGTLLHSPQGSTTSYRSYNMGASWSPISGLTTADLRPAGDTVNSNKFYAYDNGTMMVSTDGGVSFQKGGTLAAWGSKLIRVAPGREGDIWVALNGGGLARSTNSGASFSNIASVTDCGAVGFGKADVNATYPTVYIWGTVGGVRGLFRSTNTGASWVRVNDDAHEYGGPGNGNFVVGDMNTFGVVYMSTAGRGLVVGKP
jgi:xyloglucan-specific exo-beta-1,4-glucanase